MYVGHLALGLLLSAAFPSVPPAAVIVGSTWLDLVNGLSTMVGVNTVAPNLAAGPFLFFDLVFIDWDHSLLMALVLSTIWAGWYARSGGGVAVLAFVASFAHWLCDLPFHNADLAAYPHSIAHYGWGWWGRYLTYSWLLEGAFSAVCIAAAAALFARRGVDITRPVITCAVLFLDLSPWASPMYYIAQAGHPADYLLHGAAVTLGFAIPGYILVRMVKSAEARAAKTAQRKTL
ncbi:hypothetical protein VHUM_00882 [Vanrija humicola]|uniref:EXPERA domain-containing protein n=1 Tax=Vanrija humicola TaxID=5417 RepID=A0A7D8ZGF0_VANHU|nr:hypothetical protein VHUM_00882 [Vanrija humicola]